MFLVPIRILYLFPQPKKMHSGKPRAPLATRRPTLPPNSSNFQQQGSLASFILRCAVPKKLSLPPSHSKGHSRPAELHPLRMSADSGVRLPRNRSWTDLYSGEPGDTHDSKLEEHKVRNAEQLNASLSEKLDKVKGETNQKLKVTAVAGAFEEVICAIPSYALVLKQIKRTYEEVIKEAIAARKGENKQEVDAMQDMLDLMQAEKQTLLDTVMQLRRDITALSGKLMEKTTKIASLERKLIDFSHLRDESAETDSAECETQKVKTSGFFSLLSPKHGHISVSFLPKRGKQTPAQFDPPASGSISPIIGESDGFLSDADPLTPETRHS